MKTITLSFSVPNDLDTPSETLAALKQILIFTLAEQVATNPDQFKPAERQLVDALLTEDEETPKPVRVEFGPLPMAQRIIIVKGLREALPGLTLKAACDAFQAGYIEVPAEQVLNVRQAVGGVEPTSIEEPLELLRFSPQKGRPSENPPLIPAIKVLRGITQECVPYAGHGLGLGRARDILVAGMLYVAIDKAHDVLCRMQGHTFFGTVTIG